MDDGVDGPRAVLARIPEQWGREIRCGSGWWPLLEQLDAELAEVEPRYTVLQAKEKFGRLRYYTEVPDQYELDCCAALDGELAAELGEEWAQRPEAATRTSAHLDGPEHQACVTGRDTRMARIAELVAGAEDESSRTCERCGAPGQLRRRGSWCTTSCDGCAPEGSELGQDARVVANATVDAAISVAANETSFANQLAERGITTVVMDEDGRLVRHHPDGSTTAL